MAYLPPDERKRQANALREEARNREAAAEQARRTRLAAAVARLTDLRLSGEVYIEVVRPPHTQGTVAAHAPHLRHRMVSVRSFPGPPRLRGQEGLYGKGATLNVERKSSGLLP
jgi:hypothetical protein